MPPQCVSCVQLPTMPPVRLRPEAGAAWAYFPFVADATAHLKEQGIELFATQVARAAKNGKTRNGREFRSTSPDADVPSLPVTSEDMAPDSGQRQGGVLTFFTPASELAAYFCCGEKLLGDIISCPGCGQQVHAQCTWNPKIKDKTEAEPAIETHVSQGMTVCAYCVAVSLCQCVTVSLCHCPTLPLFTDVITRNPEIKDKSKAERATETHVSQGMTVCAYCVAVSFRHCVTVSPCHCVTPPPHRVMCWYIHETVTAPCVHTCITWSLCHCVPLHCPQMPSVQVMNMHRTALGSGCAPMPTMPT